MNWLTLFCVVALALTSCNIKPVVREKQGTFYTPEVSEGINADSLTEMVIMPYHVQMEKELNVVIGESKMVMEKGKPESLLGNFVADLCLVQIRKSYDPENKHLPHFCVLNNGGLRSIIPEGNITKADIYKLMPFENELVVVTLSSVSVNRLLNYIAENEGVPVSGLRMNIGTGKPEEVFIQNEPYNNLIQYNILTSDYLANGGDAMNMFKDSLSVHYTGLKVRDAIIDYIISETASNKIITSKTDGRISR